jgi:hypothetical protein
LPDIDSFARQLLEEAKRFLEKSRDADDESAARNAYLHAALMLAFRCLEAHLNAAADDFVRRGDLSLHDRSVMFEQEVRLENGEFVLKPEQLKMVRLEDRFLFLFQRISGKPADRTGAWWSELSEAIHLRNELTHPKKVPTITIRSVERGISAIIDAIDKLYCAIYNTNFPTAARGLDSRLDF